jgi:hypothetical protein
MSLDTSEDRKGVVENACNSSEHVGVDRPVHWEGTHASEDARRTRLTDEGEHGHGGSKRGWLISGFGFWGEALSRGVTGCCSTVCTTCPRPHV